MQVLGCGQVRLALARYRQWTLTYFLRFAFPLYRFACLTPLKDHVRQHSA